MTRPYVVTAFGNNVYARDLPSDGRGIEAPINADRIKKLMEHNLTEYQARVYLTLLDLGSATAGQIPALSRVPRTRIYATMQQLHERGLV